MTLIRTIGEDEAGGELAEAYARIARGSGGVANVLRAESLAPRALLAHYALYRELMFGTHPLGRVQRELVAVVASQANACDY
ncbi:MAG: carboxymuconolactone decarboxylase family protein [Planctomycetes bacterium]|nr:carboxymuconolactone decarboxylase family protein [Planctomycetota bacterium]